MTSFGGWLGGKGGGRLEIGIPGQGLEVWGSGGFGGTQRRGLASHGALGADAM